MENPISLQYHPLVTPERIQQTHSQKFNEKFFYKGTLGYCYDKARTVFKLWSPLADAVNIIVYEDASPEARQLFKYPLKKKEKGVFEINLESDQEGLVYTYEVHFGSEMTLTADPYARACIVNGARSVVVSDVATSIANFERMPSFSNPNEAIIYEVHVRDFSISPTSGITHKGKFLGVVEEGTTYHSQKTGLDYLKTLGVTHVQFLPMYDYQTVEEGSSKTQYNWGYDPQNYNIPEGSYSTNPYDPVCRIKEMKQMIKQLHDQGLRVIMDVVYNHVYDARTHPFNQVVPSYYYRYEEDFTPANGTACGNDTSSEQPMMRKYIVDSVVYWAKNFHLDGFRFDLMGNHDIETMNAVRQALDEIDPGIILLGEGWDLATPLAKNKKATQLNANKMAKIAHFNDSLRDGVKGSVFLDEAGGFVNSSQDLASIIWKNIQGATDLDEKIANYSSANQVVQYVEAHDNLTLYDKLVKTNPHDNEEMRKRRLKVASAIPLLSQGLVFIHAGQEWMRTKNGDGNSYCSADRVNQIDWQRVAKNQELVTFFKELIRFRKTTPSLHLSQPEVIKKQMCLKDMEQRVLVFDLLGKKNYQVVINAKEESILFKIDKKIKIASTPIFEKDTLPGMSVTIFEE